MVLLFVHLVLNHSSTYTVFCLHGSFSKVSKNSVSRGPPVSPSYSVTCCMYDFLWQIYFFMRSFWFLSKFRVTHDFHKYQILNRQNIFSHVHMSYILTVIKNNLNLWYFYSQCIDFRLLVSLSPSYDKKPKTELKQ